ncbi:MAG: LexA family transcriptional regulator [Pseudomonadales bacterium]|nr:LexA family transcriptional regulator [Pseudomonadales bacterium]NRA16164.1 cell division inhibitor [Oceanospirillaceae bacterium]
MITYIKPDRSKKPTADGRSLPAALDKHLVVQRKSQAEKSFAVSNNGLLGKITEIITSDEQAANLTMLLPLLATLSKDDRWFAWVSPPKNLPKSLLAEAGIALDKIMLLYPDEQNSALNLAKKALSAGTCHAVISWSGVLSEHELANLEHSAKLGASHGIVIRRRTK